MAHIIPVRTHIPRGHHDDILQWPFLTIPMNCFPHVEHINKFGTNAAIATTFEDIWGPGGVHVPLPAPTTLEVASDDAEDTMTTGTGAWSVIIQGLGEDGHDVQEIVELAGLTPVLTTTIFRAVNRVIVHESGTDNVNAGVIYIADDSTTWSSGVPVTAASIQVGIPAGKSQSQICRYTIPWNKTGYISQGYALSASNQTVVVEFVGRDPITGTQRVLFTGTLLDNSYVTEPSPMVRLPSGSTAYIRAAALAGAGRVSAGFSVILVDEALEPIPAEEQLTA